jgi:hypothetical protein
MWTLLFFTYDFNGSSTTYFLFPARKWPQEKKRNSSTSYKKSLYNKFISNISYFFVLNYFLWILFYLRRCHYTFHLSIQIQKFSLNFFFVFYYTIWIVKLLIMTLSIEKLAGIFCCTNLLFYKVFSSFLSS